MARYRLNVDYTLATQADDGGHPAFIPSVQVVNSGGTPANPAVGTTNIATGQVSVANASTSIAAARAIRRSILIENIGTTDVYIGVTGVTTATGMLLPGVKGASLTLDTAAAVFGVVGTGTQTVTYIELY